TEDDFYKAIVDFKGTSKRLQLLDENEKGTVYLDFAHSPSKVKATVEAVRSRYPDRKLIACLELHTYSSLSREFLPQYRGTMEQADEAMVYFNPHALSLKKLEPLAPETIREYFGGSNVMVFNDSEKLFSSVAGIDAHCPVYLFMSSGDFDGQDLKKVLK
ncbi:MAG TPA: cyanophycin synthetase, partial [Bacteroidales bacterium]|nr:cyanophycin synthetase [Bacteroidales bacterium]